MSSEIDGPLTEEKKPYEYIQTVEEMKYDVGHTLQKRCLSYDWRYDTQEWTDMKKWEGETIWNVRLFVVLQDKSPSSYIMKPLLTLLDSLTFLLLQYVSQWTGTTVSYFWVKSFFFYSSENPSSLRTVLSINHKALTHCSSVSWVRTSSLFWERQRLSSETTPPPSQPPLHTQTHCHRCRPPPPHTHTQKKSHFLLHVTLIGGVLVNQSCQNINGSLRITFHASKTEPRVL